MSNIVSVTNRHRKKRAEASTFGVEFERPAEECWHRHDCIADRRDGVEIKHGSAERTTFIVTPGGNIAATVSGLSPIENVEKSAVIA